MNRRDFCWKYADTAHITVSEAERRCNAIFSLLNRCIWDNEKVYIKGLGTFTRSIKKAHRIGNVNGEGSVIVPDKEVVKFSVYQEKPALPVPVAAVPVPEIHSNETDQVSQMIANSIETDQVSQMIANSISKLGLPEFTRRLEAITVALPYEVKDIWDRHIHREEKARCPYCGKEFVKRFSHQKYCNDQCREANYRRGMTEFSAYEHDHRTAGDKNVTINL